MVVQVDPKVLYPLSVSRRHNGEKVVGIILTTSGRQIQAIPHPRPVTNIMWRSTQASSRDSPILFTVTCDATLRIFIPVLDSQASKGDVIDEGVERTRARVGGSRESELKAMNAIGDEDEKRRDLSPQEIQILAHLSTQSTSRSYRQQKPDFKSFCSFSISPTFPLN